MSGNEGSLSRPTPQISVSEATQDDLREMMMGTNGNPTPQEQWGITSDPIGQGVGRQPSVAELELAAQIALQRATDPNAHMLQPTIDPAFSQPQPGQAPTDQEAHWRKLYGDSENEKGQLRKQLADMNEAFGAMQAQLESMQQPQYGQGWQQQPPVQQYGYQQPPQYPQYQQPIGDPFAGISDDDVIQGRQVKQLVQDQIAPVMYQTAAMAQAAQQRLAQLEAAQLNQAKAAAGITPVDEWRLTAKNPWLRGLPPAQRISALGSLKASETPQTPMNGTGNGQPNAAAERIVNKVTYIEGSRPATNDQSQSEALEAAFQRDWAIALQQPSETGARAKAMRLTAQKYGRNLGNPSDLAR